MGVSRGQYIKLERGERGLTERTIGLAAKAFGVAKSEILNEKAENQPAAVVAGEMPEMHVKVAGVVAAGIYREAEDFGHFIHKPISALPDVEFPEARQVAFIVEGDSMDATKPYPIPNGSTLVCIDYSDVDSMLPLRTGMKVIVERTRDGGQLREWSCKEIEIRGNDIQFNPRSTNAKHKPFIIPRNHLADDGQMVRVMAIVRQVIMHMPLD